MIKLLLQIIKFAIVGGISFAVDFVTYSLLCNVLHVHYQIAGIIGFLLSVVVNYCLSMRYVFASRDDISKKKEFIIFVILSTIGAGINALILFLCVDVFYVYLLQDIIDDSWMNIIAKIVATFLVMVYNFVTRKVFLEKNI